MFKDYYSIMGLGIDANSESIRKQYKNLCKKWHPDLNRSQDTTERMQEIIEAYLILSDIEARTKYDIEYNIYKKKESVNPNITFDSKNYDYVDEELRIWIKNAKRQSIKITNDLFLETKHYFKAGVIGALKKLFPF